MHISFSCPKCESEQTVKLSLLRMRDASTVGLISGGKTFGALGGITVTGTAGKIQSDLAAAVSPPATRKGPNFLIGGILLLIIAAMAFSSDPSGATGNAVLILGGVGLYFWKKNVDSQNRSEYEAHLAERDKKYLCQMCGEMFEP